MQPSGSDTQTAHAVYQYILSNYMERIPLDRTEILWSGPFYIVLYGAVLIGFFLLLAFWLRRAGGRRRGMMEVTSFAGQLTERVGELAPFDKIVWSAITLWAVYFIVKHIVTGIVY